MICQDSVSETPTKAIANSLSCKHNPVRGSPTRSTAVTDRTTESSGLKSLSRKIGRACTHAAVQYCMHATRGRTLQLEHGSCVCILRAEDALSAGAVVLGRCTMCVQRQCANGQMQMLAIPPKRLRCTAAESQESSEVTAEPARKFAMCPCCTATQPEGGKTTLVSWLLTGCILLAYFFSLGVPLRTRTYSMVVNDMQNEL